MSAPIPVRVAAHPYLPGCFTHMIDQRDAVARGWHFYGMFPFGVWSSRAAADRVARRLQTRGIVLYRQVKR